MSYLWGNRRPVQQTQPVMMLERLDESAIDSSTLRAYLLDNGPLFIGQVARAFDITPACALVSLKEANVVRTGTGTVDNPFRWSAA